MGRIRCFAVEMARQGRSGGITNLRFLVRPRRLETRTERGFPHFHSNGGYCSLAHLKTPNPPKSRGPPDSRAEPLYGKHALLTDCGDYALYSGPRQVSFTTSRVDFRQGATKRLPNFGALRRQGLIDPYNKRCSRR